MKPSTVLLAGSITANVVLLALFVAGPSSSTNTASSAGGSASTRPAAATTGAHDAHDGSAQSATDPDTWANLQTADLPALMARLKAEGFPPELVRAILAEQVRVQFAPRRAALNLKDNERPFWQNATHDPKTDAQLAQIMKEQDQAAKALLGPEANANNSYADTLRRQFPNLSDDKIAALQRATQSRNEKSQAILTNLPNGMFSAADLAGPEKEMRAEIAKILTPQELEDYDLRTSNTANSLRRQLASFDPTEQEFRTLFQLQRAFDDQYQSPMLAGAPTEAQRQMMMQRAEAQNQLTEQIKTTLGDQRYADYQRSIDYNYQQTSKLVSRLELPPETTNQVYAVQQEMQQRLRTLGTLPPADRNAQLESLSAEAQAKITSALGQRGYEAYKQYGGSWLQQLQPRPIPPPRAVPAGGSRGGGG